MLIPILLLLVGFAILIKGANFLVDGAVLIAEKFRVSPLIIGLTIVAFGTSAPELAVNIVSALNPANSDIGLGNIVGSNIANIGLIVGLAALIMPLSVKKVVIVREIPFMFLSGIVFLVLVSDRLFQNSETNALTSGDGVILLLFFIIFVYYLAGSVLTERQNGLAEEYSKEYASRNQINLPKALGMIILGLVGVVFGGKLVVDNASELARAIGISEILIGLTIVAVGTSLPEIATSLVAAMKKEADIAVGNIVGSNIFNTFFILGINAAISPVPFGDQWYVDAIVMVLFAAMLFITSLTGKIIKRWEGSVLLLGYIVYTIFVIGRG